MPKFVTTNTQWSLAHASSTAILILGHHSKLTLALAGNRAVPWNLASLTDRADGFLLGLFGGAGGTGKCDSENERDEAEFLKHGLYINQAPQACKPAEP